MNQTDIQIKIDVILDNMDKLSTLKAKKYEDFVSDFRNIDSAIHRLQTSIQALLDIGSYVISSLGLRTPNTNAEIIKILGEHGYIPKDKIDTYVTMSQFRNRIVHLYNHIDIQIIYDILSDELHDIKALYINLLKVIEDNKDN